MLCIILQLRKDVQQRASTKHHAWQLETAQLAHKCVDFLQEGLQEQVAKTGTTIPSRSRMKAPSDKQGFPDIAVKSHVAEKKKTWFQRTENVLLEALCHQANNNKKNQGPANNNVNTTKEHNKDRHNQIQQGGLNGQCK